MGIPPIIKNYPEAKNPAKYARYIDDGDRYDAIIEPFAGAARFSFYRMIPGNNLRFFWADADPLVKSIYDVWGDRHKKDKYYLWINKLIEDFARCPKQGYEDLVSQLSTDLIAKWADQNPSFLAAASLVVRSVSMMGIVRWNSCGKFGVSLSTGHKPLLRPSRFKLPQQVHQVKIFGDFSEAIAAADCEKGLCFIDPPYWHDTKKVCACYSNHDAATDKDFHLCVDAFTQSVTHPGIKRIVVTNYYSDRMDKTIKEIAGDRPIAMKLIGTLQTMNNAKRRNDAPVECCWEIGDRAQTQLTIF